MAVAMVRVKIRYEIVDTNDEYLRYLGRAIDEALPNTFWQQSKYVVGMIIGVGDAVQETVDLAEGQHYIIVGTSADDSLGYWHQIKVSIIDPTSGRVLYAFTSDKEISRNRYMYCGFRIRGVATGTSTVSDTSETTTTPDQTPEGVEGAGATTGGELSTMMEQMRTTMGSMVNMMAQVMMMMAMMQMMVGMMGGLASAMGTAF